VATELGNLSSLVQLNLQNTQLSGNVPPELGNLSSLAQLNLFNTQLSGSIPPELGNLSNLNGLNLYNTQISGSIPPELGNLSNLDGLRLYNTQISGSIPPELGNLSHLMLLDLSSTKLNGSIPPELSNLISMFYLSLEMNALGGDIPSDLANLENLSSLYLGFNKLTASDSELISYLNTRAPNWADTQTVPPTDVQVASISSNAIDLSWTPVKYSQDGYYEVAVSTDQGGYYEVIGTTRNKTIGSYSVEFLEPNTTYCFTLRAYTPAWPDRQKNELWSEYSDEVCSETLPPPNLPPVANAGGPYSGYEGATIAFDGSSSFDPDENIELYEWDLDNDGDYDDATGVTTETTYFDNGVFTVGVRATDAYWESDVDTAEVTVNNVAPTCGAITAPIDPVQIGQTISVSIEFTDPGLLDTHSAEWSWGDGLTLEGIVIEDSGSGSVSGDHTYMIPGVYTLNLTVTDDDGGWCDSLPFEYVVVFDPDGGFVTGGGWIDSPEGAYTLDPTLSGKASFGFVSKYKKGADTPTGETEFQFRIAGLNFHSETYDWLVVAGARAQFKGTGMINGEGNFGFMLTAIDANLTPSTDVDMFRIKIWDKNDDDAIVYDNHMDDADDADLTTAVGGGSIVIHKAK